MLVKISRRGDDLRNSKNEGYEQESGGWWCRSRYVSGVSWSGQKKQGGGERQKTNALLSQPQT